MYDDQVDMMELLRVLAPLKRTLASRETDMALEVLLPYFPGAQIEGFQTGAKAWSWTIPSRWELNRATVRANGEILVDSDQHYLHVVNYSQPFKGTVSRDELFQHLHTSKTCPDAIPFVYRFYQSDWGFCVPHRWLNRFTYDRYEIEIDSRFEDGYLNILSAYLKGENDQTIIFCSNICHPTQANDSLTGVAVAADLFNRLYHRRYRKYSYLFLVVPEVIGSVAYLANHEDIVQRAVGGFVTEMLGTQGPLVGQLTRKGNTYWDFVLSHLLKLSNFQHRIVPFLKSSGNDEKVLDSPGVDIPTWSLTRNPYVEYHTSFDNLSLIDIARVREGRNVIQKWIDLAEEDYIPVLNQPGPIFLSGYGLYPDWQKEPSLKEYWCSFLDVMYAIDGYRSMAEIAHDTGATFDQVRYWCERFAEKDLLRKKPHLISKPHIIGTYRSENQPVSS